MTNAVETVQISKTKVVTTNDMAVSNDPYDMSAVTELLRMMEKLEEAFAQLRDVAQKYIQKQSEIGFNQQLLTYDRKTESAVQNFNAELKSGSLTIAGGVFAGAGIGFGFSKFGKDIGTTIGRTGSEALNGVGTVSHAIDKQGAELDRIAGELLGENAQNYMTNLESTRQLAQKFSAQMNEINRDLTQIYAKLTGAIRF